MEICMEKRERLKVILEHWIRHNEVHLEEYRRWANRASSFGFDGVRERILAAAEKIAEANAILREAQESL